METFGTILGIVAVGAFVYFVIYKPYRAKKAARGRGATGDVRRPR